MIGPLQLRSDFHDYYDHWFDRTGPTWRRNSAPATASRSQDLLDLRTAGFRVPRFGPASSFHPWVRVVAYLDPRAHRGEGKVVGPAESFPATTLCRRWVESPKRATSLRLLACGWRFAWLRYASDDEWRSNVGDARVDLLEELVTIKQSWHWRAPLAAVVWLQRRRKAPLQAVDFVEDARGKKWAVDLNVAPRVGGTPLEDRWSSHVVRDEVTQRWWELRRPTPTRCERVVVGAQRSW